MATKTLTKPKPIKSSRNLPHKFNEEEITTMTNNLVNQMAEITKLEAEKKAAAKDFKNKIEDLQGRNNVLAKHIRTGEQHIDTAVEILNHYPADGKRTVTRMDTNEQWVEDIDANTLDTLDGWEGDDNPGDYDGEEE